MRKCEVCHVACKSDCRRQRFDNGLLLACKDCCFFRDNLDLQAFVRKARKIDKWKSAPGALQDRLQARQAPAPALVQAGVRDEAARRASRVRSQPHGRLPPGAVLIERKSAVCGACATGVDRNKVADCYQVKPGGKDKMVASCTTCNRMCRDKGRNKFVTHMRRVAAAHRNGDRKPTKQ